MYIFTRLKKAKFSTAIPSISIDVSVIKNLNEKQLLNLFIGTTQPYDGQTDTHCNRWSECRGKNIIVAVNACKYMCFVFELVICVCVRGKKRRKTDWKEWIWYKWSRKSIFIQVYDTVIVLYSSSFTFLSMKSSSIQLYSPWDINLIRVVQKAKAKKKPVILLWLR